MENLPPPVSAAEQTVSVRSLPNPPTLAVVARRWSVALRLVLIAMLVGALHVPLLLIWDTLKGRESLRHEAVSEIGRTWGGNQVIVGPVLLVPYVVTTRVPRQSVVGERLVQTEETRELKGTAHFLPSRLEVAGDLDVSVRHRGIFRTPVYAADLLITGEFRPDLATPGLERAVLDWSRARVLVSVGDAHGFRAPPVWKQGAAEVVFAPGAPRGGGWNGIEAPVSLEAGEAAARAPFTLSLSLQGSRRLAIVPIGEANAVTLRGAWADPSFDGAYLPVERTLGSEGFSARWATTHFGRGFPAAWLEQPDRESLRIGTLHGAAFGVTLATPVETYRMVERSLKYALLILVLVFAVYFLFEVTSPVRVHPLQYLMVGGALVLFYLGFLALAEFAPVAVAYGVAAGSSTLLVAGYSWSVLKAGGRSVLVGAGLGTTYGYLYFMLQLQDYSLLAGTTALFVLLALAMWFTRRLDWNSLDARTAVKA